MRGKPELLTKMRYQAVSNMVKKGREEQEKKISVGDQMMSGRYAPIRFNKFKRSPKKSSKKSLKKAKAITPLETIYE